MTIPFLDRMAVADLAAGSVSFQALPQSVKDMAEGDTPAAALAGLFPDGLILSAGRLTGSYAPAACALTARVDGQTAFITGHCGAALRRCGLDALVIRGSWDAASAAPAGLALTETGGAVLPLHGVTTTDDAPAQRVALHAALTRAVSTDAASRGDAEPVTMVAGPAAFLDCASPALVLDTGIAPRTAAVAKAMAARGLAGMAFAGAQAFLSPVPLENAARAAVEPARVTPSTLAGILRAIRDGVPPARIPVGRSMACYACPAPCRFWMRQADSAEGFAACTSPEGLAMLLEKGATPARIAAIMALAERYGLDPAALGALANAPTLPGSVRACAKEAGRLPEFSQEAAQLHMAENLGVCPFFLRRFPRVHAPLENLARP